MAIKGQSYDRQLFYSIGHRLINNLFLNGTNGIVAGEGNSCKLTNTNNSVTVDTGFFIVQGGITQVISPETVPVVLNGSYCRLVYEVDMSKQNTDTEFVQGQFKVITGSNSYPSLTQQKLMETSGIYQMDFAQFRAMTTGISEFIDKRTYIDYQSIFELIRREINNIEDGSLYVTKNQFHLVKDTVDELNSRPIIIVSNTQPVPQEGKTIVWLKPKN